MSKYNWIKEINYKEFLTGDLAILEEIIGIELLLEVIERFGKTAIYISEKPIMEMKKEYVRKNYGYVDVKELARKIGLSERMVYELAHEKHDKTGKLFDGK